MVRERNEVIYSIAVEDIYLAAESYDRDEADLTPEVIEKVIQKIEAMDFSGLAEVIDEMIDDAIEEEENEQYE